MLLFIASPVILYASSASQLSKVLCFVSHFLFIVWILVLSLVIHAKNKQTNNKASISTQNSKNQNKEKYNL